MISRHGAYLGLAILLIVILATGSVVHSLVPHKHSHGAEPTSPIWDSLHSALRGEDKKILAAIPNSFIVFTSFLLLVSILEIEMLVGNGEKNPSGLALALRRGIVAYRAFG